MEEAVSDRTMILTPNLWTVIQVSPVNAEADEINSQTDFTRQIIRSTTQ